MAANVKMSYQYTKVYTYSTVRESFHKFYYIGRVIFKKVKKLVYCFTCLVKGMARYMPGLARIKPGRIK